MYFMELGDSIQQAILNAATKIVVSRLRGMGTPIDLNLPDDPSLLQPAGCFVSLHRTDNHALRGCIGVLENPRPLREILVNASESVLNDPRFSAQPVTAMELEQLDIEVSVMGPLTPVPSPLHFEPKLHGICLNVAGRSGLFLPQVARETGWDREQLLARLCYEKLGLAPLAWKHPSAQMRTFTAIVIGPKPIRELI
jgi:AmmeMemoRadiSam system protein A